MAKLKVVNVTFHTSDDNKRPESSIEMILNDQAGHVVARAAGSYGTFDDGSTNGPFGLQVLGAVEKTGLSLTSLRPKGKAQQNRCFLDFVGLQA